MYKIFLKFFFLLFFCHSKIDLPVEIFTSIALTILCLSLVKFFEHRDYQYFVVFYIESLTKLFKELSISFLTSEKVSGILDKLFIRESI